MQFTTRQVVIIIATVLAVVLLVFLISTNIKPPSGDLAGGGKERTNIVVWGVDSSSAFSQIAQNYEKALPEINIDYRQFKEETFEDELLSAWAAGIGPDVVMVKNRSFARLENKLLPLSPSQFGLSRYRQLYPTVTEQDFVDTTNGYVYALPLYVDTLAFLYDRDAFDQAGVLAFPDTWEKLAQEITKLRELTLSGQLTKSSIAMGGTNRSVINGADLLLLIMLQNGADFSGGTVPSDLAAKRAFDFYLQFSNPSSPFYSWNESSFGTSFDAFVANRTAIIPIYYGQLTQLLRKDPFLRYQIAPMTQIRVDSPINYADYWGLAVSRQSKQASRAWQFVRYVAEQPSNAAAYAQRVNKPPALKALLERDFNDPIKGVFAKQALTARSWPGPNDFSVRQIISNSIAAYLRGELDASTALSTIKYQVSQIAALR